LHWNFRKESPSVRLSHIPAGTAEISPQLNRAIKAGIGLSYAQVGYKNNLSERFMLKKIIAVVLIVLAGGTWAYLDYLNKQELLAAEEIRQSMIQARAQALARAKAAEEAKAKFEATIMAELTSCKAAAEKTKEDFLEANKKPVRRKPGQFTVPQAAQDEANKAQEVSNAACQSTYDTHLKSGS
jgi:hypothetical protein